MTSPSTIDAFKIFAYENLQIGGSDCMNLVAQKYKELREKIPGYKNSDLEKLISWQKKGHYNKETFKSLRDKVLNNL